jgi:predicted DNA-binding protein
MSAKPRKTRPNPTLTISLSKELKERIEAAAKRDRRPTSNFVAVQLEKLLAAEAADYERITGSTTNPRLNEPSAKPPRR